MLFKVFGFGVGVWLLMGATLGTASPIVVDMVTVGDPGNMAEQSPLGTVGCGKVDYTYQIGKYEITNSQYCAFLNAVATTDTYELFRPEMTAFCGITQNGAAGSYSYGLDGNYASWPIRFVSWGDAARFCNWMHNAQPQGPQGLSTTEDGSYLLNGATSDSELLAVTRREDATWVIPSEDEWYKAAYNRPESEYGDYYRYATRSDDPPGQDTADSTGNNANYLAALLQREVTQVGEFQNSYSAYGAFDMTGNVSEWNEAVQYSGREYRGGDWGSNAFEVSSYVRNYAPPTFENGMIGFRVAQLQAVPEPSTMLLLCCAAVYGWVVWKRKA